MQTRFRLIFIFIMTRLIGMVLMIGCITLLVLLAQFCQSDQEGPYFTESELAERDARITFIVTAFARFEKLDSLGGQYRLASTLPDSIHQVQAQEAMASYRKAERLMNAIIYAIPIADTSNNYPYQRAMLLRDFCRSKISMIDPDQPNPDRLRYAIRVDSIQKALDLLYSGNTHSSNMLQ